MKLCGELEVLLHFLLTSLLDGYDWSVSCMNRFVQEEIDPQYPLASLTTDVFGPVPPGTENLRATADWYFAALKMEV
jgi:hypothetical protein